MGSFSATLCAVDPQRYTFLAIYLMLWVFSLFFTGNFVRLHFLRREMTRYNFKLDPVPTSVGVSMVLCFLVYQMGFLMIQQTWRIWQWSILEPGLGALSVAFLGLYDDMFKRHERSTLKTHLAMLLSDRVLDSGVLSVMGVFLVAMVGRMRFDLDARFGGAGVLLLNVLLITLSCTFLGLINTRPLRALKAALGLIWLITGASLYLAFFLPEFGSVHQLTWRLTLPVAFIAMGYWRYERQGRASMGAVGANFLGFILGLFLVNELSYELKLIMLGLLALVHIVAMLTDLGELIDRVFLLNLIDRLGQKRKSLLPLAAESGSDPSHD